MSIILMKFHESRPKCLAVIDRTKWQDPVCMDQCTYWQQQCYMPYTLKEEAWIKKTLAAWYYFDGNNFLYDHLHVENAVYLGKYKDAQRLGQTRFSPHIYSEK